MARYIRLRFYKFIKKYRGYVMDDLILIQSKKLRRRVEEKLRQCKVEDLIKIADFLGVLVQRKLRVYLLENRGK